MLIQKIFHVRLGLAEARSRLSRFHTYAHVLEDVDVASFADETALFEFTTKNGFEAKVELIGLPSDEETQTLFRSVGGNMQVAGMIEFVPIRDNCTEVQVTVEYAIHSPMHSVFDAVTNAVDRFVNKQLRRIEAHFKGRKFSGAETATRFVGAAQLAH
ncbi:MAG TPA: hypothetical protein VFV83_00715 [Chthoniobacteraceae bacterium]|nr:hypothetical protein [Chthoniobacteraceae bacterium]